MIACHAEYPGRLADPWEAGPPIATADAFCFRRAVIVFRCHHVHITTPDYTAMQDGSAVECSHGERLKRLRAKLQVEWADLAQRLDISPSMCYQVARGSKNLSELALFRLSEAERASGIAPPALPVISIPISPAGEFPTPLKKDKIQNNSRRDAAISAAIGRAIEALQEAQRLLTDRK